VSLAGVLSGLQSVLTLVLDRGIDFLCSSRLRQPILSFMQAVSRKEEDEEEGEEQRQGGDEVQQRPVVRNPLNVATTAAS
jgi:hypothetical protein